MDQSLATAAHQVLAWGGESGDGASLGLLFFLSGFIFYGAMYLRYRNINKRHMHARETEATLDNVQASDEFVGRRTRQSNSRIRGANEREIRGAQNRGFAAGLLDGAANNPVGRIMSSFDRH